MPSVPPNPIVPAQTAFMHTADARDADAALAEIARLAAAGARAPWSASACLGWLQHSDERVAAAALRAAPVFGPAWDAVREAARTRRALVRGRLPVGWSPFLDAYEARFEGHLERDTEAALAAWLRAQRAPEAFAPVAGFTSAAFRALVAQHWGAWTAELLAPLVGGDARCLECLARNPRLRDPALLSAVGAEAARRLFARRRPDGGTVTFTDGLGASRALGALARRAADARRPVPATILPADWVARATALLDAEDAWTARFAARALGECRTLTPAEQAEAFRRASRHAEALADLLRRPALPPVYVRQALERDTSLPVRKAAAARADALRDPVVRERLAAVGRHARILQRLAEAAPGAEAGPLMARLARINPELAVRAAERGLQVDAEVPATVLLPALKSGDPDLRRRAQRMIHQVARRGRA